MPITHAKVLAQADGADSSVVRPSDWNNPHTVAIATAEIDNDAVTFAKMQNIATDRLIGRDTAATGDPEEISLDDTLEFTGSGGIQRAALTGDVTATAGSNATTIANDAVTYAKIQNVSATDKLLGRSTSGAGDVEEIACTAAGRALIDDADATAQRTTLGLGVLATLVAMTHVPAGRVTLETAVPVSVTDQTAKTSVFYAPYQGELVPIYDGALWTPMVFTELTLALDSDSGHTGYQQSGKNFDLFVASDSGTIRLGTGPAWTSDTARGTGAGTTELERKNGIWTNKVSMTVRFGSSSGNTITVAANRGTYVGTMRASANGQCEDSVAKRFLWNTYNRASRPMKVLEATNTWTYSTAAFRQMNGSTSNQLAMVRGLDEDSAEAVACAYANSDNAAVQDHADGIGLDSTTAYSGLPGHALFLNTAVGRSSMQATYFGSPGLGYHYLAALERASGTGTTTWFGDDGLPGHRQNGIHGVIRS